MKTLSALFLPFYRGNFIDVFLLSLVELSAVTKFSILIPNHFFFLNRLLQEKLKMKLLKEFVFVTLFGSFAVTLYARAHESSNGGCELKTRCLVYVHRIIKKNKTVSSCSFGG